MNPDSAAPSAPAPEELVVRHNPAARRFEVTVGGVLAVADYELAGNDVVFTHTFVPPVLRGRGLAERLVRAALQWAAAEQRRVVRACSFVAVFVERNPEFRPLLRHHT
jgi:hypothetical protein